MSFKSQWPRPYPGVTQLPDDKKKRLTVEIPLTDFHAIVPITLKSEILVTIAQYGIARTAEFCRTNKLTTLADYDRLIEFICQRPVGGVASQTATPDDGRGKKKVRRGVKAD